MASLFDIFFKFSLALEHFSFAIKEDIKERQIFHVAYGLPIAGCLKLPLDFGRGAGHVFLNLNF